MALPGGPHRLDPDLVDDLAEDRAAARRGDYMGPRELDALADRRENADTRAVDARWER